MKTIKQMSFMLLLTLCSAFLFTSCEEDWWDIEGEWEVVETSYNSPYRNGDYWVFDDHGYFQTYGYTDLNERGYWDIVGHTIQISFNGYDTDLEAYIRILDDGYMVLDVYDNVYRTRYTLRLVRRSYHYYSQRKLTNENTDATRHHQ